jgi:hypothetical protein
MAKMHTELLRAREQAHARSERSSGRAAPPCIDERPRTGRWALGAHVATAAEINHQPRRSAPNEPHAEHVAAMAARRDVSARFAAPRPLPQEATPQREPELLRPKDCRVAARGAMVKRRVAFRPDRRAICAYISAMEGRGGRRGVVSGRSEPRIVHARAITGGMRRIGSAAALQHAAT